MNCLRILYPFPNVKLVKFITSGYDHRGALYFCDQKDLILLHAHDGMVELDLDGFGKACPQYHYTLMNNWIFVSPHSASELFKVKHQQINPGKTDWAIAFERVESDGFLPYFKEHGKIIVFDTSNEKMQVPFSIYEHFTQATSNQNLIFYLDDARIEVIVYEGDVRPCDPGHHERHFERKIMDTLSISFHKTRSGLYIVALGGDNVIATQELPNQILTDRRHKVKYHPYAKI
uniref:AlNc14C249G9617 protein n=1 Tax=Albugo laibachii Nc14 TaxID=890382 RepID=F0WTD7_9STRA|nr:AlNc14C249G9617 [Albugo laibachii Nc14]|eukprot:CCA24627.1 AlNc14C249G9617 [Albugo laibachii Nc14]